MEKETGIAIGVIGGVIVLGGIGYLLLSKIGKKDGDGMTKSTSASGGCNGVKISYVQNHGRASNPTSLAINGRPAYTNAYNGKMIRVSGTGTDLDGKTVQIVDVWKDANGKLGAFYVAEKISQQGQTRGNGCITFV